MYTSKFEVYKPMRKHRSKRFFILLLCYVLVVSARICTMLFLGWVIEADPQYERQEQRSSTDALDASELKGQKYFYVSALLKFRVLNNSVSFKKRYLDYGELVVVKLQYPFADDVLVVSGARVIANALTFGLVKSRAPLVLRRVVALPGDTVVYNSKQLLSVNGNSYSVADADPVPFLGTNRTVLLGDEEYFLLSQKDYGIDDKVMGPSARSVVRGKILFKFGPEWGWYYPRK